MIGKSYKICTEDGCDRQWAARGLCTKHYAYRRKYGTLPNRKTAAAYAGRLCSVADCTNDAYGTGGLCPTHTQRLKLGWPDWDTRPVAKKRQLNFKGDWRSKRSKGMLDWEYTLHRNYGLQKGDYDRMLEEQDGRCAICGVEKCSTGRRFAVDHCHETGVVRGLLCAACNHAIGKLADCPERMMAALIYLIGGRLMAEEKASP
jgi:hypothetical protein